MSTEPEYEVLWPLGKRVVEDFAPAERPGDLNGRTVVELWDWLFRGDEMFPVLREQLRKRFPNVNLVGYQAFGPIMGWGERARIAGLPDFLRKLNCKLVITGVGA